jgi:sulfate adenylyltransferase subunit 2
LEVSKLVESSRYTPHEDLPESRHLDALESRSIFVIREAYRHFGHLAMLWSVGKDSSVLLWLVRKAFLGRVPFPLVHIDTTYKIPEMIQFRDALVEEWGLDLRVGSNRQAIAGGQTFPNSTLTRVACCGALKTDALQQVIAENHFQSVMLGIRRDEDGTRSKERYYSPRGKDFRWDFYDQPPELWDQFKTEFEPGTHLRIHPLLHWTELNVWEYIDRERIPVVPVYFSRQGRRYRSLGCAPCTMPIESQASTVREILEELRQTRVSERSTRAQDQEAEDAFERLRAEGYM